MAAAKPRNVILVHRLPPVIIMTDAAADETGVTLGALLCDLASQTLHFFGAEVREETVHRWKLDGRRQVIGQAELVAVPVAFSTWSEVLRHRDVFVFIDNDSATAALVRGASAAESSDVIANTARLMTAELSMACWYERVPSPSNPADLPSRRMKAELIAQGFTEVDYKLSRRVGDLCVLRKLVMK